MWRYTVRFQYALLVLLPGVAIPHEGHSEPLCVRNNTKSFRLSLQGLASHARAPFAAHGPGGRRRGSASPAVPPQPAARRSKGVDVGGPRAGGPAVSYSQEADLATAATSAYLIGFE